MENLSNARQELQYILRLNGISLNEIRCADLSYEKENPEDVTADNAETYAYYVQLKAQLTLNYTQEALESFLQQLDFEYYGGYGAQYLHGTIWLTDGRWLTRGEYDGSEWWEIHVYPEIPEALRGQTHE